MSNRTEVKKLSVKKDIFHAVEIEDIAFMVKYLKVALL